MSRQVQITFDAADPEQLGSFWASALGYVEEPPPAGFDSWPAALDAWGVPEDRRHDAYAVVDPDGSRRIYFQRVPEPKTAKNRVHLDVRVSDKRKPPEQQRGAIEAETERLEGLGAIRQGWGRDVGSTFMVLLDPEGNEFCLT